MATLPQWLRLRTPIATPCSTRRSPTRPTRWAPSSPAAGRCRAARCGRGPRPRRHRSRRRGAGAAAVGRTARQPDRRPRRPRTPPRRGAAANGVPVFSDECYVEFTWDGPARTILEHGLGRRGRRALAVEALEPRRPAGRLLRRRRRARRRTCRRCASTSACSCPARRRPRASSPSTTTPTSPCSATATARRLELMADDRCRTWSGIDDRAAGGRLLPLVRRRRRLGVRRAAGHRGRRARQPGRLLRQRRCQQRPCRRGTT